MSLIVRSILEKQGRLAIALDRLDDRSDLHQAGLDSMAMVNVMLAIEQTLGIEFPDEFMSRSSFSSIAALDAVLRQLAPDFEAQRLHSPALHAPPLMQICV
jgi:acyl carrier protein